MKKVDDKKIINLTNSSNYEIKTTSLNILNKYELVKNKIDITRKNKQKKKKIISFSILFGGLSMVLATSLVIGFLFNKDSINQNNTNFITPNKSSDLFNELISFSNYNDSFNIVNKTNLMKFANSNINEDEFNFTVKIVDQNLTFVNNFLNFNYKKLVSKNTALVDKYEINNKTYVTINSGSMSYKNKENSYLKDMNLNDQIKTYSLISLEKVNNNDNIKLFDIYAYKNNKNNLIVHRVIAKLEVNNEIYYTFRGDANSSSDYYLVKSSDILYHYTGYSNYPLGIIFSFSGSYVGLVSITYTLLSLIILDIFDNKKVKLYESQFNSVKDRINQEEINKLPKVKVIELK